MLLKSYVVNLYRFADVQLFSSRRSSKRLLSQPGEADLIVRSAVVNRPSGRFLSNLRDFPIDPQQTVGTPSELARTSPSKARSFHRGGTFIRRGEPAGSLLRSYFSKGVAIRNRRPGNPQTPQFNHRDKFRVVGGSEKPNQLSGGEVYPPATPCQVRRNHFLPGLVRSSTLR